MAPVQSRQLLMWSFPTAVVLFSYLYYKRKKTFLKSDTGGNPTASNQVDADSAKSIFESSSICESLESSINEEFNGSNHSNFVKEPEALNFALQKVIRELETIAPIPEDTLIDEIVEDVLQITDTSNIKLNNESECRVSSSDCSNESNSSRRSSPKSKRCNKTTPEKKFPCDQSIIDNLKNCDWGASDDETIVPDSTTKNSEEDISVLNSCKNCKEDTAYVKLKSARDSNGKKKKSRKNQVVDISIAFSDNDRTKTNKSSKMNFRKKNVRRSDHTGRIDYRYDSQEKLLQHKLEKLTMDERTPSKYTNQNSLRDSANHSPAEAMMLASPTLSHCSDNHSEGGSSDSGKGCSEVATPAGGSSLAGDHQLPIVFEFCVPQPIVGRLIGFKGHNLHDLRARSHTNMYIKMHPETSDLRICAIEGTVSDVDTALALIRKKFPLSQNPDLTLERISPSDFNLQIKPDYFQLHLVENMNNDVVVSSLISAGYMFLQQPTHPTYQQLSRLNFTMNANYTSPDTPAMTEPQLNAVVAAPAMGGWYRAQIVEVFENNQCQVRFLDYGGYSTLDCTTLRKIRADFLCLPFQAIECALANVVPSGGSEIWSEEARLFVYELTVGRVLQAQIYDYAVETGIPLVYLYSTFGDQVILINEELVKRGFAELPPALPVEEYSEAVEGVAEGNLETVTESEDQTIVEDEESEIKSEEVEEVEEVAESVTQSIEKIEEEASDENTEIEEVNLVDSEQDSVEVIVLSD